MTERAAISTAPVAVFDDNESIGFLRRRGRAGTEAFDISEQSLGLFKDDASAATAIWKRAHNQPEGANG